jgi:hypothetical protein
LEFQLVRQEEFEAEQDGHEVARWIALGKFGQQREGAAQEWRLVGWQPNVDAAHTAWLSCPSASDSRKWLPREALMMDIKWDNGKGSTRIEPT